MTNTVTEIQNLKIVTNIMSADIKEIKADVINMKMDIQRMCGIISKLKESQDLTIPQSKSTVASQAVVALHSIFPLKTKEQLDQLEKDLKTVEKEAQLVRFYFIFNNK